MLVLGQTITKKWDKRTRHWYEDKGYVFTNYGDEFNVKVEDLSKGAGDYIPIRRGQMTYSDAVAALEQTQKRDTIKTDYCNANNIQLIRIPYWDFDSIEIILTNKLLNLHEDIV